MLVTRAGTCLVVCFSQYLRRKSSGSSDSQQTSALTVFNSVAGFSIDDSMSPREISKYSSNKIVTDCPADACAREPSKVRISLTVAV